MTTRVCLYIRVSTEEQAEEGWSVDAQERVLRDFCKSKGWKIVEVYKDEGKTGTNTNRPGFKRMLHDARENRFDVIVVHKLDRFSRNLIDVLMTLDDLHKIDVSFVSATEAMLDFTTQIGRFILTILAFFAEWYVNNLSIEVAKGKRERFQQGLYNGDLRFAYSKAKDGRPVPNDDRQYVAMAWQLTTSMSDQLVASRLNAAGSRTYRMITGRKKAGPDTPLEQRRPWTKDSITMLFSYEAAQFYLGNTVYLGEEERKASRKALAKGDRHAPKYQVRVGTHEAIIDEEIYKAAMAARAKRTRNRSGYTTAKHPYYLGGGLARCSVARTSADRRVLLPISCSGRIT